MIKTLQYWFKKGKVTAPLIALEELDSKRFEYHIEHLNEIEPATCKALSRSILIRHLDTGSCNAEETELLALSSPYYDITRYGIDFTASPRHADVLAVTGPVTRHLKVAMERTYQAMPNPKVVVAIGDGACCGNPYDKTYACLGPVDQFLPVDVYIPGDPPSPREILEGFLQIKEILLSLSKIQ